MLYGNCKYNITWKCSYACYSVTVNLNCFYSCMVYLSTTQLCRCLLTLHITIHVIFSNLMSKETMRYISCAWIQPNVHQCIFRCSVGKLCTSNKHSLQFQPIASLNNVFDLIIFASWFYRVQPKPWSCGIQFLIGLVSINIVYMGKFWRS